MHPTLQLPADVVNFFYPRACCACGRVLMHIEKHLCFDCMAHLPKTNYHKIKDNEVEKVFWGRIRLNHATSYLYFSKQSRTQHILHNIKYNGYQQLGFEIGSWFGYDLKASDFYKDIDYVIPVPLHPKKLKIRGFNQSDSIGRGIARGLKTEFNNTCLKRLIHNPSQTKKSRFQRWENVKNIFGLTNPEILENKHILLIDDVITTGSTIEACVVALEKAKNVKISVASVAFA